MVQVHGTGEVAHACVTCRRTCMEFMVVLNPVMIAALSQGNLFRGHALMDWSLLLAGARGARTVCECVQVVNAGDLDMGCKRERMSIWCSVQPEHTPTRLGKAAVGTGQPAMTASNANPCQRIPGRPRTLSLPIKITALMCRIKL